MMNKSQQNILPLALVSFFLAFNYFILKALKETLLLTAQDAGAEAIPFVKVWLLFPFPFFIFIGHNVRDGSYGRMTLYTDCASIFFPR